MRFIHANGVFRIPKQKHKHIFRCEYVSCKTMKKYLLLFGLLSVILSLAGCATNRKLQAASILKQSGLEVTAVRLVGFELDKTLFPATASAGAFPNAQVLPLVQKLLQGELDKPLGQVHLQIVLRLQNRSQDTLWIDALQGEVSLDTLLTSPLSLVAPIVLKPGYTDALLLTEIPLDKRLFTLESAQTYAVRGVMSAALKSDGKRDDLEFNERKKIPAEAVQQFVQTAQKSLIEQILTNWVGSLL